MRLSARTMLCTAALASLITMPLAAQAAPDRGEEIVREVERRSRGYRDLEAQLVMRIREGERERIREMRVSARESEEGDRTRLVLERPADLAGTEFLSALEPDGGRNQWIYLPAARRVRRIGGAQGSDSFFGSHFTYDDMTPPDLDGFAYRWIRDEEVGGRAGALVERTSSGGGTAYPRQLLWIETERHVVRRIEFFNPQGERRRMLEIDEYMEIDGFWLAARMTMTQLSDGGSTTLEWSDIRLGVGLDARDFDPSRLGN